MAQLQNKVGDRWAVPMAASTTIAQGAFVFSNGSEQGVNWSDAASLVFRGIANDTVTSSAVANADKIDTVRTGIFRVAHVGGVASTAAIGTTINALSGTTVTEASNPPNNDYKVGTLVEYESATWVWIDITGSAL